MRKKQSARTPITEAIVDRWFERFIAICEFALLNHPYRIDGQDRLPAAADFQRLPRIDNRRQREDEEREADSKRFEQLSRAIYGYRPPNQFIDQPSIIAMKPRRERSRASLPDEVLYDLIRILYLSERNEAAQRRLWTLLKCDWPAWLAANYLRESKAAEPLPWPLRALPGEFDRSKLTDLKESLMASLIAPLVNRATELESERSDEIAPWNGASLQAHKAQRQRIRDRIRAEGTEILNDGLTSPLRGTTGEFMGSPQNEAEDFESHG